MIVLAVVALVVFLAYCSVATFVGAHYYLHTKDTYLRQKRASDADRYVPTAQDSSGWSWLIGSLWPVTVWVLLAMKFVAQVEERHAEQQRLAAEQARMMERARIEIEGDPRERVFAILDEQPDYWSATKIVDGYREHRRLVDQQREAR